MWFLPDVLGLFSNNVVPFSRIVGRSGRIFSTIVVPKTRMLSVPMIYILGPLQVGMPLLLPCTLHDDCGGQRA